MKITFDIERLVPKYIMQDRNGRALAKAIEAGMKYVAKKAEDGLDIITDPDKMPEELKAAHHQLDLAVERCYRTKPFESDEERLKHLFDLYERMIAAEER